MAQQIKEHVNHKHSNIFVLIELLQKTQANTEANQIQISAGDTQRPKLKMYRNIDNRLSITQTPILESRTYRPRLRRQNDILSPHGNSTVV
jgi:uncharacterized transporter YbjL